MKLYAILIALCLLQGLICNLGDITLSAVQKAFMKSLPYAKTIKPQPFILGNAYTYGNLKLYLSLISLNNVEFKFIYKKLYVKFYNLKISLKGLYKNLADNTTYKFSTDLTDFIWENTYDVNCARQPTGEYHLNYHLGSESQIRFNAPNYKFENSSISSNNYAFPIAQLKAIKFTPLKQYLNKIMAQTFENLKSDLNSNKI